MNYTDMGAYVVCYIQWKCKHHDILQDFTVCTIESWCKQRLFHHGVHKSSLIDGSNPLWIVMNKWLWDCGESEQPYVTDCGCCTTASGRRCKCECIFISWHPCELSRPQSLVLGRTLMGCKLMLALSYIGWISGNRTHLYGLIPDIRTLVYGKHRWY